MPQRPEGPLVKTTGRFGASLHFHPVWGKLLVYPMADEKLFKAEYVGSGTFLISKPKRKKAKMRLTKVRNPQRGARR